MTLGLLLLAALAGGTALTFLYDDDAPWPARLGAGAVLGLTLLALLGFVLASLFGLTGWTVLLAGLGAASPLWLLRQARWSGVAVGVSPARPRTGSVAIALVLAALAVLLWRLYDRALFEGPDGRIATGIDHNIGDLPFHIAIVTGFLHGQNFPPEHPELLGARLTYPVLADFLTALLMKTGAGLRQAMFVHNLILAWALLLLLHRWAATLTRDRAAALLAPLLILFSGGLGFLKLADDVDPAAGGLLGQLGRLGHDYTIVGTGELRWGNLLITMLVPQRSFLLGLPLFLIVWTLWWQAVGEGATPERRRRLLGAAGLVAGMMPLAHVHAFAVALGMGACLALLFPDLKAWGRFFVTSGILAAPQVLWLAWGSGLKGAEFLGWQLGWDRGARGVFSFWSWNLGLFLPAALVAIVWRGREPVVSTALARFTLPFLLCFLVPNLVRLSPWIWDNLKFLVWWHIAWSPLVALLLARLWRLGGGARPLSVLAGLVLTLSGALDLWRVASRQIDLTIFPADAVSFAGRVRAATPPKAVILHAPTYNSEVYLTGRRSVLGYPGHIWSQGLDAGSREEEIKHFYAGEGAAGLLARYGVGFVLVGPREYGWSRVDEPSLRSLCPPALEEGEHVLLRCGSSPPGRE